MDSCEYFLHLLRKTKYMSPHLHVKDHKISLSTESVTVNFHWLTCFWAYQVQTGSPRLPSSAWHSTPVFRWRTVLCRWYAGWREVVSGRRPPVCWMSDRHAALLLLSVHLPQLHVPGFGTVFLMMSRLPHLYWHFGENCKHIYFDIILWLSLSIAIVNLAVSVTWAATNIM